MVCENTFKNKSMKINYFKRRRRIPHVNRASKDFCFRGGVLQKGGGCSRGGRVGGGVFRPRPSVLLLSSKCPRRLGAVRAPSAPLRQAPASTECSVLRPPAPPCLWGGCASPREDQPRPLPLPRPLPAGPSHHPLEWRWWPSLQGQGRGEGGRESPFRGPGLAPRPPRLRPGASPPPAPSP